VTSAITSNVVRTISAAISTARGPAALMRSALRRAAAVITGARFITLRCEKTGAAARRCQRQCAPSAMKSDSPMAGRNRFLVTRDFG